MLETVVVGAGVTGLRVAARLAAEGRAVTVLEARQRVGGRLLSVDGLDLGATWFWPGEPRIGRLVADLGLRVHQQHLAGDAAYEDGRGAFRLDGNPVDVPAHRFSDGAASLAHALHAALPPGSVRCGEPVTAVRVGEGGVAVDHPAGPTRARTAVLALPPALAAARIAFDPPLPPALAAAAAGTPVWMGAITKVVAVYDAAFWREAGLSGSGFSRVGPIGELHDMSGPGGSPAALFGFVPPAGPTGGELASRPETVTAEAVLAQLSGLFGPRAGEPRALHIQDWRREEWTSPPGVEDLAARGMPGPGPYAAPAHGRVWLASTETSPRAPGHIEGALTAADLVADALLR